jgi:hypothetical protein
VAVRVKKQVIVFTDAPAHNPERVSNLTAADIIGAALVVDPAVVNVVGNTDTALAEVAAGTGGQQDSWDVFRPCNGRGRRAGAFGHPLGARTTKARGCRVRRLEGRPPAAETRPVCGKWIACAP